MEETNKKVLGTNHKSEMGPNPLGSELDLRASQCSVCVCLRYTTHLFKGFFLFFFLYTNVEILFFNFAAIATDGWMDG